MFCNKNCKKCNHYKELIIKHQGKPETIHKWVFEAIMDSLFRQEAANIRIQAAIESSRNEQVKLSNNISKTIAHGFLSLVKQIDDEKKEYIEYKESEN